MALNAFHASIQIEYVRAHAKCQIELKTQPILSSTQNNFLVFSSI